MVTVRKVESAGDYRVFSEFPWTLYQDDPNWVPPLRSIREETLNPDKNPAWTYMEGAYYIAWRDDEAVGTIAAFVNKRHNAYQKENIAWFGFFEVQDDAEAANALLQAAVDWAAARGYDAVRGPQSFTNTDECGLLVDGFSRPILLMPYNPPYYQRLIEESGLGFAKVMDAYAFYTDWEQLGEHQSRQRMKRLLARIQRNSNIEVRSLDRRHLRQEFEMFVEIYNAAWNQNWGFTPFGEEELDALVSGLGMIVDPRLGIIAHVDGQPAGFLLCVPDFAQVLHKAYPKPREPEALALLRAVWHWKVRPMIEWARVPLMGVRPEYRTSGVDLAMYDYLLDRLAPTRYKYLESGWVLETNTVMLTIAEKLSFEIYKTYRFYEAPTKTI